MGIVMAMVPASIVESGRLHVESASPLDEAKAQARRLAVGIGLCAACQAGDLDEVHRLIQGIGQDADAVPTPNVGLWTRRAFEVALYGGHVEAAAALFDNFDAHVRPLGNHILQHACEYGKLDIAKWVTRQLGLTAADARDRDNYALRHACDNGHDDVAKWLVDEFNLEAADAMASNAIFGACRSGRIEFVSWVIGRFDLKPAPATDTEARNALVSMCINDRFELLQWVVAQGFMAPDKHTLCTASEYGRIHMVQWLVGGTPPNPAPVKWSRVDLAEAMQCAVAQDEFATAAWLVQQLM